MSLSFHTISPNKGSRVKAFRVGRGEGSGRGKTAGKGTKGQRARSGGRGGLKLFGLRGILLSTPKLRGFNSRYMKAATVDLKALSDACVSGERIDIKALKAKDLIHPTTMSVKIVGNEGIDKPLKFMNIMASAAATAAIEKAGGKFERSNIKKTKKAVKVKKGTS
jgi:large subunit ribosomal protein L15